MGIGEISDAFFRIFCLSRRICNTFVTPYMIYFISMRFLRVIKLTKAEKNMPLSLEFIPDYLELRAWARSIGRIAKEREE